MLKKDHKNIFYCFTPLVSLATFIVEFIFAVYTLIKYRKTEFGRVSIFVLLALASFQLPEYLLCQSNQSAYRNVLIQIGFIGTAFLPPLGLHLVNLLNDKKYTKLVSFGYIFASFTTILILASKAGDFVHACTGKYVKFGLGSLAEKFYSGTYLIFITSAIVILLYYILKNKNLALNMWMLVTFLVFLIPAYVLYFFSFYPSDGLPSVMCGFAIFAALILLLKILPKYHNQIK